MTSATIEKANALAITLAKEALGNIAVWLERSAWKEYLSAPRPTDKLGSRALPYPKWLSDQFRRMSLPDGHPDFREIPGSGG